MELFLIIFLIFFSIIGVVDTIRYIFTKFFRISNKTKTSFHESLLMEKLANENVRKNMICQLMRIDNFTNETPKIINISPNSFEVFSNKETTTFCD